MAPSATATQSHSSKVKRPVPSSLQTNGINSSTSSPSPSMSAGRLPTPAKYPPNSAASNGAGSSTSGPRSANRQRRDAPPQLLGRGQRNSSVGLRSSSIAGDSVAPQSVEPLPYVKSDEYILKRYQGNPPSLILHLHPTHFRFDQQEGSFTYKSPMRILIEHLKQRTIPHDLVEFMDVPYYEGCMIVQIHDHKSTAPSQDTNRVNTGAGKATPFSVHNYNTFLTPSPHVPYPTQNIILGKGKRPSDRENDDNSKSAEQKDKENMPAPAVPNDPQRSKPGAPRKPKISTIVLHPTPLSEHVELANKAAEARSNIDARRDSRQDNGPLSATVPPTPSTAVPSTPQLSMAPPAKRLKKGGKMELDSTTLYAAESQITLATTAPLILDPVSSASESAALLESLAHPMHIEKPPSPKTRKRTVAEMAADEALAADQERYMLTLDERLSSSTAGAPGGANPADGNGQAGGASFEPRFEKFKVIENIRAQHEENKRMEKLRREEAERKLQQDRERDKLRADAEKKEQEKMRNNAHNAQLMQQAAQRQQQQDAQRRQLAAQAAQQGMQMPPQVQGQHAHPQPNGMIPNGIQGQPQRFHQQQVSQAQVSSPIVRNGTPQSNSSPMTNNMGNVPMQHSTSSMGGSPARPGSVVQQNHPPMGAPGSHGMVAQRSQQSHAGTPRMPNSTPNVQNTPLNRGISQTPRMSQGSPLQGPMAPVQQMPMMPNGQPMQMSPQQQQQLQHQIMQQRRLAAMQAQQQQNGQMAGLMNGQLTQQQQQQILQQQLLRQQQQQQQGMQQGMGMPNHALTQAYGAQMAAMAQQRSGMPPNMNQNFMNGGGPNMQQMQMQQQMQMRQAQMQAQLQAQAQAQQQQQQPQVQMNQQQLQYNQQVMQQSRMLYQNNVQKLQSDPRYAAGIPEDELNNLKARCQQQAQQMVQNQMRARKAQMLAAQNGMQQGIPQGMNMQNMQGGMGNGMGM